MTQVKICGVCSAADARAAFDAGADYIGVILARGRSRSRSVEEASAIFAAAGTAARVGVFVDASPDEMLSAAGALALDVVQLHGDEAADVAAQLRAAGTARIWKAVHVRGAEDVDDAVHRFDGAADALLFDAWSAHARGGVGVAFDWDAAAEARARVPRTLQVIAAGGLDSANVARAVAVLSPDIVDVSSGVESAPCSKSTEKLNDFIAAVRGVSGA